MSEGNQNPVHTDSTLTGDGTSFAPLSVTGGGAPGGTDGQVQFNDAGAFGGIAGSSWDKTDNALGFTLNGVNSGLEINPGNGPNSTDSLFTPTNISLTTNAAAGSVTLIAGPTHGNLVNIGAAAIQLLGLETGTTLDLAADSFVSIDSSAFVSVIKVSGAGNLGFFNAAPIAKPTVTGAKLPGDVVMASLLTALKNLGLINDTTT